MPPPPEPEPPEGRLIRLLKRYPYHFAILMGLLFFPAIRPFMRRVPDPPPVLFELPQFELTDQDGQPFSLSSMNGKVWIAGFIFTRCPSICPRVSGAMRSLQDRFEREDLDTGIISISVDPANDTPEVLGTYAEGLGADPERWRFLTGEEQTVRKLVIEGFKVPAEPQVAAPDGTYDIIHSMRLAIVDGDGGVRGYYDIDDDGLDEIFHRAQHVQAEAQEK